MIQKIQKLVLIKLLQFMSRQNLSFMCKERSYLVNNRAEKPTSSLKKVMANIIPNLATLTATMLPTKRQKPQKSSCAMLRYSMQQTIAILPSSRLNSIFSQERRGSEKSLKRRKKFLLMSVSGRFGDYLHVACPNFFLCVVSDTVYSDTV